MKSSLSLPLLFLLAGPSTALAGPAHDFTVVAGTAVTCTDSYISGDVAAGDAITQTGCTIEGAAHLGDAAADAAYAAFLDLYASLATAECDQVLSSTLADTTLSPGVYCFDEAVTLAGTLTLEGSENATWLFLVGTSGTGALTATDVSVVMSGGADACNVTWWTAEAATLTTTDFQGTVLAGADMTVTGGTYEGDAMAGGNGTTSLPSGAVTLTGADLLGCEGRVGTTPGGGNGRGHCNQGVGNGTEGCDPGNSNQGDSGRSNDELGGTPGNPGRKGGNR